MPGTLVVTTLSDGTNSTSATNAIQGSSKAWVNFNGVTTVSIRASFNHTSVTRNAAGDYTSNLTTALADGSYSLVTTGCRGASSGDYGWYMSAPWNTAPTSSAARYCCTNAAGTFTDYAYTSVTINR